MQKLYIVTGANGHLGTAIIKQLQDNHCKVRGLLLPFENTINKDFEVCRGDVRNIETLRPLFENYQDYQIHFIHTAGIVDITENTSDLLIDVNINGTKNIITLCKEYKVHRLLYVSSVHAIPEKKGLGISYEVSSFSADAVHGGYAKTKATASQLVMDEISNGLNAIIVHPSGIIGPYSNEHNHLVQLISNYMHGLLPVCVRGGYDFVDVRDVANGCLLALEKGKIGNCYILSNNYYKISYLLEIVRNLQGGKKLISLPIKFAEIFAPIALLYSKKRNIRPLYTAYSLFTLKSKDRFSHDKASLELGYTTRPIEDTVKDTVEWLNQKDL